MLVTCSWLGDLRRELGVVGVSPLWDGGTGYYFWIEGAPGPFQLQLREASTRETAAGMRASGVFAVKCYPRPESSAFVGFSQEERDLVRDAMFDDTGTPRFEAAPLIGPDLFVVGVIECVFGPGEDDATFVVESADRMIVRNATPETVDGKTLPAVLRDARGWDMSFLLFDRIVKMWAAHSRSGPAVARLSEDEGFETLVSPEGDAVGEASSDSRVFILEVVFGEEERGDDESPADSSGRTLYEFRPDSKCTAHIESRTKGLPFLDPRWWTISMTDFQCDKTGACGCE
jgi:hypothetical protein